MTRSSGLHETPARDSTADSIVTGAPPLTAIFFRAPALRKPTQLPSGEKNGWGQLSVSVSAFDSRESISRRNRDSVPLRRAEYTSRRPLGEIARAGLAKLSSAAPGGRSMLTCAMGA